MGGHSSYTMDIETCGLNGTDDTTFMWDNEPFVGVDPRYAGLNRAQRRKAMSVERRAFRKGKL